MNKNKLAVMNKGRETKLASMAAAFQGHLATIENSYMLAAQILYDAREMYDETEKQTFIDWAMEMSGYSEGHINKYIRVHEQFGLESSKIIDTKNPIPFMTLVELTNKKVSKATVKKVLTKYNNKKPENRPTVKEVKAIIKEDAPPVVSRLTIVDVSTPYVDAMAQAILQPEGTKGNQHTKSGAPINGRSEPSRQILSQARAMYSEGHINKFIKAFEQFGLSSMTVVDENPIPFWF